jgi:hypothetical protein
MESFFCDLGLVEKWLTSKFLNKNNSGLGYESRWEDITFVIGAYVGKCQIMKSISKKIAKREI